MTYVEIPDGLFRELAALQSDRMLYVDRLAEKAIRQFIDAEKSDDKHIWIDGIRYPIPESRRMP